MSGTRRKVRVGPDGPEKDAERVDIQQANEYWNEYLLADGSIIKLKVVATEVWRVENEYDADGNPVYLVKSQNVLNIISPDQLRR